MESLDIKRIREDYDMPIFFISARKSDDNVLMALNIDHLMVLLLQ